MALQRFVGTTYFVSSDNPTPIIIDPSNGVVQTTLSNINLGFLGGIDAQGNNPNIQVLSNLAMDEGTELTYSNGSSILENGSNLLIEAPGNVIINNLVSPSIPNVNGIINDLANLSNEVNGVENSLNSLSNTVNSYQNSLTTNQLLVSGTDLQFKVNLSSSPQVSLNANGATLPFLSVERNFGGDFAQTIHEGSGLGIIHSYTSIGSDEVPYLTLSDNVIGKTSSIYFGANDPNINLTPDGGSMYLRNNGDILMGDGANWISYLGALVTFNSEINALQSIVSFRDSQEIFVSADGSDITGNGSSLQPYQTIQKAITEA